MVGKAQNAGFTLVEMAMVIVIIGLVMLAVFPALQAVRSAGQRSTTIANLHSLMLATAAYVQANGCMPCPASPGAVGANFGIGNACGSCPAAQAEGIPPFVTLGLPASTAHDGWGHWITMRVDTALTAKFAVTPPSAGCQCGDFAATNLPAGCSSAQAGTVTTASCTALNAGQKGMCAGNLAKTERISVTVPQGATQQAAVIFVSHGSTGYGSFFAQPISNGSNGSYLPFNGNYFSCSASGGYAMCNSAGANSTQFYDAPTVVGSTDPYDDILAYADRNTLVSMLGNGGCQTVW